MPNNNTQQFKRSERLIELGRILFQSAQGFTALELGRALGCHRSTIYRDIDSLSKLNVPIWERDGRFGMHKDRYITSVRVNLHESLSLYLSARLLSAHSDKHNPHVVSALEKLASALPESIGQHITRTAEATRNRRPNREYIRVLETFTRAWSERKQVRLTYYNPYTNETTESAWIIARGWNWRIQKDIPQQQGLKQKTRLDDGSVLTYSYFFLWGYIDSNGRTEAQQQGVVTISFEGCQIL